MVGKLVTLVKPQSANMWHEEVVARYFFRSFLPSVDVNGSSA